MQQETPFIISMISLQTCSLYCLQVACVDFTERCLTPAAYKPDTSSLQRFLTSIALPQYAALFAQNAIVSIEQLLNHVRTDDLQQMGMTNTAHVKRLRHQLKLLRHRQPSQHIGAHATQNPQRNDSGYSTIDKIKQDAKRQTSGS